MRQVQPATRKYPAQPDRGRPRPLQTKRRTPGAAAATPDLQAQLHHAVRYGHSIGATPIQADLVIGQPGDKYEQEADAVAAQAMQRQPADTAVQQQPQPTPLQRQTLPTGDMELPAMDGLAEQANDTVKSAAADTNPGAGGGDQPDPAAVGGPTPGEAGPELGGGPGDLGDVAAATPGTDVAPGSAATGATPPAGGDGGGDLLGGELGEDILPPAVTEQLAATGLEPEAVTEPNQGKDEAPGSMQNLELMIQKATAEGSGAELADDKQGMLRDRLGILNPEEIRIHDDSEAHELCELLGARAFTTRNHIFFGAGEYGDDELLFHEATHCIQQGAVEASGDTPEPEGGLEATATPQEEGGPLAGDAIQPQVAPGQTWVQADSTNAAQSQLATYDAFQAFAGMGASVAALTTPSSGSEPDEISRDDLIGQAMAQGAIQGAIQGGTTLAATLVLGGAMTALGSKAPMAAGGIGAALTVATTIYQLATDPKGFAASTFVTPFKGPFDAGGPFNKGSWDNLTPWLAIALIFESMIAIIEMVKGILNIIDLILNLIASILTLVGNILLGVGLAMTAIGNALLSNPFTAAFGAGLVSAGLTLQSVGNMLIGWGSTVWAWEKPFGITILQLTLYTLILRPFVIAFRILDLKYCDSDPAVLLKKQEALSQSTAKFINDGASAGSKVIGDKMKTSKPNKAKVNSAQAKDGPQATGKKSLSDDYFGKKDKGFFKTTKNLLNPKNTFGAYASKSGKGAFDPGKKWKGLGTSSYKSKMGYDPANVKAQKGAAKTVASSNKNLQTAGTTRSTAKADMQAAKAKYDAAVTNPKKSMAEVQADYRNYATARTNYNQANANYQQAQVRYNQARVNYQLGQRNIGSSAAYRTDDGSYGDLVSGGDRKGLTFPAKVINDTVFKAEKEEHEVDGETVTVSRFKGALGGANVSDAAKRVSEGKAEIGDRGRYFWETLDFSALAPAIPLARAEDEDQAKANEAEQKEQGEKTANETEAQGDAAADNAPGQAAGEAEAGEAKGEEQPAPEENADSDEGKLEQVFNDLEDVPDLQARTEEEAEDEPEEADIAEADESDFEEYYAEPSLAAELGEAEDEAEDEAGEDASEEDVHPLLLLILERLAAGADELPEPPWEAFLSIDAAAFGLEELAYQKESNAQLREDNQWAIAAAEESAATHEVMLAATGAATAHIAAHKTDLTTKIASQEDLRADSATQQSEIGTAGKEGKSLQKSLDSQRSNIDKSGEYGASQDVDDSEGNPDAAQESMAGGSEQMDAFQSGAGKSVEQASAWIGETQAAQAQADSDQDQLEDFGAEHHEQLEAAEAEMEALEANEEEIETGDEEILESEEILLDSRQEAIDEIDAWTADHAATVEGIYDEIDAMIAEALEDEVDSMEAEDEAEEAVAVDEEESEEDLDDDLDDDDLDDDDLDAEMTDLEDADGDDLEADDDDLDDEDDDDLDDDEDFVDPFEVDEAEVEDAVQDVEAEGAEPLPADVQAKLSLWGVKDADQILIHTGEEANAMCAAIAAHAAVPLDGSSHIFFAAGQADFSSDDGLNLLLHEVAHLAQLGAIESGAFEDEMPVEEAIPLEGEPEELMADFLQEHLTRDADLSDADLQGLSLRGFDLSGADLQDADLTDADLRDIDLSGADLRGTNLTGADLAGATLKDIEMDDKTQFDEADLDLMET